jgi:hypothetical protein
MYCVPQVIMKTATRSDDLVTKRADQPAPVFMLDSVLWCLFDEQLTVVLYIHTLRCLNTFKALEPSNHAGYSAKW